MQNICKNYVLGKCNNLECRFEHKDNICRSYFLHSNCNRGLNCKFSHSFVFSQNKKSNNFRSNKNTETFEPDHSEPSLRVYFNQPIYMGNEVSITNNLFNVNTDFCKNLMNEIPKEVFKPWHEDSHLIADDRSEIDWKADSPTFQNIVRELSRYFCMTVSASRFNYYTDSKDWKPYHHDAAALKPDKAKTQNITVGVSFGLTREISFESIHSNKNERITINFPLENGYVYAFGNQVNIDFKHGIPQIKEYFSRERISIILWGFSSLLL